MNNLARSFHEIEKSGRFARIKQELFREPMHLCTERARLITEYFKRYDNPSEPMIIRKAKAFRHLLSNKSAIIYPDELIVGNVGAHRKSAIIQPELASVFMMEDLLWIDRRKTTPFRISWPERLMLLRSVIPYWLTRNMTIRAFAGKRARMLRYLGEQLKATFYLINEVNGIGHFLPNYEKMIKLGVRGYLKSIKGKEGAIYTAAEIACEGLLSYARRLSEKASRMAQDEHDETRAGELREIARICARVPEQPASSFHEALQSLWLTHMAVCLESMNSAVSFGRMDQYLHPYYRRDVARGRINAKRARELLLCFSAKATEHVFHISERASLLHGGYLVVQAAIVGGIDRSGKDAANELTDIFLDVMEESGLRDPNYQVRIHPKSSKRYVRRALDVARCGNGVPALFNDEMAIAALQAHGYPLRESREYAIVGCVEPSFPGKSFFSTDAALFNIPVCLELALNRGRKFGSRRQIGLPTPDPVSFTTMSEVLDAFRAQLEHMVSRFVGDIQIIERGNRDFNPTPFSSLLVDGCMESGRDLTEGGALYNSSGIQGVGVADTADSLAALDHVVFKRRRYSMAEVIGALRDNFAGAAKIRAELGKAPKFGNDNELPDGYAQMVALLFHTALSRHKNTRGGPYVPGFYSSTCHVAFGMRTGALPSGRLSGEPFAPSLGAAHGADRQGATALLNSVARIDSRLSPNGYALNLRFDPGTVSGERGVAILESLMKGFFSSGGLEMQMNVLDATMLADARRNPGKYPGLVVRVAGYCAYFDDLPDRVKAEIITRTRLKA